MTKSSDSCGETDWRLRAYLWHREWGSPTEEVEGVVNNLLRVAFSLLITRNDYAELEKNTSKHHIVLSKKNTLAQTF